MSPEEAKKQVGVSGNDKIIEVTPETERRHRERRASDQDLAARIAKLEAAASEYRLWIAATEQHARERRYALLRAAAQMSPWFHSIVAQEEGKDGRTHYMLAHARKRAVDEAEALLAEIEKREKERQA